MLFSFISFEIFIKVIDVKNLWRIQKIGRDKNGIFNGSPKTMETLTDDSVKSKNRKKTVLRTVMREKIEM